MSVRVAALLRLSTKKQAKKQGKGDLDVPAQRQEIERFVATKPDWRIIKEYVEAGVSAYSNSAEDRDILQDAMRDAKARKFDVLLMWKGDRLSRRVTELPAIIERLCEWGIEVWSVVDATGGKRWTANNALELLMLALEGFKNQSYSESISINVKTRMRQLVEQGKWWGGKVPFGYRLSPVMDGRGQPVMNGTKVLQVLVPDERTAPVVREMYSRYLRGEGDPLISEWLNNSRVQTYYGAGWQQKTVRDVLTNPIYAGILVYGRGGDNSLSVRGEHEAIIDEVTWHQAQGVRKEKRALPIRQRTADYPLSGVLRCALCRGNMGGHTRRQKRKNGKVWERRYYRCLTEIHRRGCEARTVLADAVEEAVVRLIEELGSPGGMFELLQARTSRYQERLSQYEDERRRHLETIRIAEQAISRAKKAFLEEQVLSAEDFKVIKTEYEAKRTAAEEGMNVPPPKDEGASIEGLRTLTKEMRENWTAWDRKERKTFILSLCTGLNQWIVVKDAATVYFKDRDEATPN